MAGVPVLFSEFEGDILAIVVLLVEFALELLVDAFVLLAGEEVGGEFEHGEGGQQPELLGPEETEERFEHYYSLYANLIHTGRILIITGEEGWKGRIDRMQWLTGVIHLYMYISSKNIVSLSAIAFNARRQIEKTRTSKLEKV
jgi:hypothetical protein